MKNYLIHAEIEESMPDYTFIVEAENFNQATEKANAIVSTDYPDYYRGKIDVTEIQFIDDVINALKI